MLVRAKVVVLVLALAAASLAVWSNTGPAPAGEPTAAPAAYASQDYRSSQFAAQTGWMTFRELWFTYSGR